jgi:hypothetical protein
MVQPEGHAMSEDTLDAALARAQAGMQHPKKTKTNPHFKSDYADLADVLNAVRPALNAEGIAVVQSVEAGELVTELRRNGESIRSAIPLNLDVKPQELGSQLSYLRRYALSAIAGVASESDDDGNAASTAPKRTQARKAAPAPKVNPDGEPLATTHQTGQFIALAAHLEMDKQDRADYVQQTVGRAAWKDVTRHDADKLIAGLKGDKLDVFEAGDGTWKVIAAGAEPFDA